MLSAVAPPVKFIFLSLFAAGCLLSVSFLGPWTVFGASGSISRSWSSFGTPDGNAYEASQVSIVRDNSRDVRNATLGFQEVQLISLPSRSDKRDSFAMQASLTGISYHITDGVDGKDVAKKARPYGMAQSDGIVGCWRAHLNVLEDMVRRQVSSMLVFEDDADWDVSIKSQLVQFARGSRYIQNQDAAEPTAHSPYGDDWDLLWIGHCGAWGLHPSHEHQFFVIPDDATVVPPKHSVAIVGTAPNRSCFEAGRDAANSTRIVFSNEAAVCTTAYAISLRGAQKALYHLSLVPYNSPIDWGFSDLCGQNRANFTCIAPYPQLVGIYRPEGDESKYSDINPSYDSPHLEEQSWNVMFSTRMNIARLLDQETVFTSQFPDVTGPEMAIDDIGGAVGHPETLDLGSPACKPEDSDFSSSESESAE